MNRALLQSTMASVSESYGYPLVMESARYNPTSVNTYPIVFMTQPTLVRRKGLNNNRTTYATTLTIMQQGAKLDTVRRNELYDEMEMALLDIFNDVAGFYGLVKIDILSLAPSTEVVDSHGAISVVAKIEVITHE